MKIAVVNANSKIGKHLVAEAASRGFDVTVFVSSPNETVASEYVQKDPMDITADDLKDFDAVIDSSGVWDGDHLLPHFKILFHLCDCLSNTNKRFLIVGGEGANYSPDEIAHWFEDVKINERRSKKHSVCTKWFGRALEATPSVSEYAGELADYLDDEFITMDTVLTELKKRKDVNWVFMDPSCELKTSFQEFAVPYDDYAKDMLDEIQYGVHYQQRVGTTCK